MQTPPPPTLTPNSITRDAPAPWWHRQRKALLLKRRYADQFEKSGHAKVAKQLRMCSESEHLVACTSCGGSWWVLYRCGLRCCPICSWREAKKRQEYLAQICKQLGKPKHIVLTIPRWTGEGPEGIKHLRDAIAKLRRRDLFKNCRGGALTIEVLPKPDGWHIHAHLLVDAPYMPWKQLQNEWSDIIGVKDPHVSIQAAECDAARRYVAKYAGKSIVAEVGDPAIVRWFEAIKGKRMWGTFGAWFNFKLVEQPRNDGKPCFVPGCILCGSLKTVVPAESLPNILGKGWRDWCTGALAKMDWSRPLPEIISFLSRPEPHQPLNSPLEG